MTRALLVLAVAAGAARAAQAQSIPNVTAPKRAAQSAVAATNAHTATMTADQGAQDKRPASPSKPAADKPAPRSASAPPSLPKTVAMTTPPKGQPTSGKAASKTAPAAPAPSSAKPAGKAATPATTPKRVEAVPAAAVRASAKSDTLRPGVPAARPAATPEPAFRRETFSYDRSGRRDPFASLMNSGEIRPLINDVRLVGVLYSADDNSVAILRDLITKEQYRVRVGQTLGRMRVARIESKKIVFTIEEFGFSRQQELLLDDLNSARKK
jgi:hypothetical protein